MADSPWSDHEMLRRVSLACQAGSLTVAWQLYLPKEWANDAARRENAGVRSDLQVATKGEIALSQISRPIRLCGWVSLRPLLRRLPQCMCCPRVNARLRLWHSKARLATA